MREELDDPSVDVDMKISARVESGCGENRSGNNAVFGEFASIVPGPLEQCMQVIEESDSVGATGRSKRPEPGPELE